jgi:hypothetical protein
MHRALIIVFVAVTLGCGRPALEATATTRPVDSERQMYEDIRSARYQIGVANERLSEAVNLTRALAEAEEAEVRDALEQIAGSLSKAGSLIADYDEELPAYESFQKEFGKHDDDRLKTIEACITALSDVDDALGTADDLLESGPPEEPAKALREIKGGTEEARDALKDAVRDLGGKVEPQEAGTT